MTERLPEEEAPMPQVTRPDVTEARRWAYDAAINVVEEVHPDCPSLGTLRKMLSATPAPAAEPQEGGPSTPPLQQLLHEVVCAIELGVLTHVDGSNESPHDGEQPHPWPCERMAGEFYKRNLHLSAANFRGDGPHVFFLDPETGDEWPLEAEARASTPAAEPAVTEALHAQASALDARIEREAVNTGIRGTGFRVSLPDITVAEIRTLLHALAASPQSPEPTEADEFFEDFQRGMGPLLKTDADGRIVEPSPEPTASPGAGERDDDPISDSRQPEDGPPPGRWPR